MDIVRLFANTIIPVRFLQEELIWETPKGTKIYTAKNSNKQSEPKSLFLKTRDAAHPETDGILREFQNLQLLQSSLRKNELRNSIPQPLGFESNINCAAMNQLDGICVQKEVYFRLITGLYRRKLFSIAKSIGKWIGQFQLATKHASRIDISSELEIALSQLPSCPGLSSDARKVFKVALQTAIDSSVPLDTVFCHGDLGLRNIMLSEGNKIRVVDWENMAVGHPVVDPVFLISNIQLSARYLARLELSVDVSLAILNAWYKYARDLRISDDIIVGLAIAGVLTQLCRMAEKDDIIFRKRVLSYVVRVGLRVLRREWMCPCL